MDYCKEPAFLKLLLFAQLIIDFIKIAVPIGLILVGSIDLSRAVMAGKDEDIKKNQSRLMKRAMYAAVVFFVPTIAGIIFGFLGQNTTAFEDCAANLNMNTIRQLDQMIRDEENQGTNEVPDDVPPDDPSEEGKDNPPNNDDEGGTTPPPNNKPSVDTFNFVELRKRESGKLTQSVCNQIKSKIKEMTVQQVARFSPKRQITIFVNYSNCEFITVKNDSFNAATHWDYVTAGRKSAERLHAWFNNKWQWSISYHPNLKLGGMVYFDGHWVATATNGCPHGSGKKDSGLVGLDTVNSERCANEASKSPYVIDGGQLCMHFRKSILNVNHQPDAGMQRAIDNVLKDSRKYKK